MYLYENPNFFGVEGHNILELLDAVVPNLIEVLDILGLLIDLKGWLECLCQEIRKLIHITQLSTLSNFFRVEVCFGGIMYQYLDKDIKATVQGFTQPTHQLIEFIVFLL